MEIGSLVPDTEGKQFRWYSSGSPRPNPSGCSRREP